ncbi:hypothetical protein GTA08_BOTSDO13813 [Neofusicoccum parvum]|uniref:Uncharacterized protein n=1 Tax=Neofusicoccum parvum TaxID=310453 RepID=A0ACB5RW20_9PEZI|nr:hypothetical protein GTA08_BOTSDO13813 [Neofusicoccum parvum]
MHLATKWEFQGLRPHIAIIDAVSLTASRGVYHAAPIAAEIRKRGNIERLWYKGQNEYFVWGEITQDFILCDLPFDLFRSLTDNDFALVDLLGLEDINPERSLSATRRAFLGQAVVLDAPAGQTIGRAMSLFGLGMTTPSPMVEQFVYNIFQGWALGAMDVQFMAEAFVVGLRDTEEWVDNCVILSNDQVDVLKGAFVNGVSRATKERKK